MTRRMPLYSHTERDDLDDLDEEEEEEGEFHFEIRVVLKNEMRVRRS